MRGINILDYATLTVPTGVVSLGSDASPTLPAQCKRAYITCETDAVRWRADGTDPASDEGHSLAATDSISFMAYDYRQLLEKIRFTRVTSDAKLKITYYD